VSLSLSDGDEWCELVQSDVVKEVHGRLTTVVDSSFVRDYSGRLRRGSGRRSEGPNRIEPNQIEVVVKVAISEATDRLSRKGLGVREKVASYRAVRFSIAVAQVPTYFGLDF
jgi:hypothetical protein